MTAVPNFSKAQAMFRGAYLLLVALVASLTLASATHAREIAGSIDIECSGVVHSEGDADQSPGEPDKGLQHHGHCHMATALVPSRAPVAGDRVARVGEPPLREVTVLGRWIRGPALRPPIA